MSFIGMLRGGFVAPVLLEAAVPPVGSVAVAVFLRGMLLGFFGFGFGFGGERSFFTPPVMDLARSSLMLLLGICWYSGSGFTVT